MVRHYLHHWSMGIVEGTVEPDRLAEILGGMPGMGPIRVRHGAEPGRALVVFQEPVTHALRGLQCATGELAVAETGDLIEGPRTFVRIADHGCARQTVRSLVERFGGLYRPTDRPGIAWERIAAPSDGHAHGAPVP
ncbi:hypothetical protein BHAOGJBA_2899 [Methylobacterium hispanicum]|uniref:Uncharacterized protein n=1 Tax=Methylobacterium hispanicum TaxID=270350 RepID=A0AAV4ZMK3_9HYPH|nr:hypothetical protein [Methylobacterium hispanicum]GJD89372.1 hypothetical protein BHAOGJBA_2899 [Methylobacterium hispanicum]